MATQVIKTTFQFKRGSAQVWVSLNPVLAQGGPGFEYDTGLLKIGNGLDAWNDLPYVNGNNESSVVNAPSIVGFPAEGKPDVIYKAENEKQLYQWNSAARKYEVLGGGTDISAFEEKLNALEKTVKDIVAEAPTEFDTFKEVADWILNFNPTKNAVDGISVGGNLLEADEEGIVNIPIAAADTLGVVKASDEIEVNEDGSMEVGVISFSKIAQEEGMRIILDSGDAFEE